ncbi:MAG: TatD family deoxyribonuclease [Clostridiales bacterium]|nr:TatD family deoxyribonuclease [Clostridiales bacterium]
MLYDSHAHLNSEYFEEGEREEFMEKTLAAVDSGLLSYVNDIGCDLPSSKVAYDNAQKYPWCYAVVGCHPHKAKDFDETQLMFIKNLAGKDKVQAIGEIGLDFYYDHSPRDEQRYWFRRQIQLANELRMPIVIHSREADKECLDILKEEGAFSDERKSWFPKRPGPDGTEVPDARVLLHCFSGSAELAKQYVKLGATISMAGPVTYKNNRRGVETVAQIPVEFLLVETDSPFLTPVPHRGKKNCPAYVEHTARRMAVIKGIPFEELARITCENAKRFFNIK